jgi:AraC family transcriptional regulator
MVKETTYHVYHQRMAQVLLFIQQNLDENLALERLARVAHFSPYHFHRIFRGMVGESVKEHIRRLRLERAALRLKRSDRSVTVIAFEAGFENLESFSRAFKAMGGITPSAFRRKNGVFRSPAASGVHYQEGAWMDSFQPPASGEPMKVKILRLPPMKVAFVRHVGPYHQVGTAWEKVCMILGKEGLLGSDSRFIGVCYDDPEVTPEDKIRYDACVTVGDGFSGEGDVQVRTIGGGEYAVTTHAGPYDQLKESYARLFGQWLPHSGRELRSEPSLEFYLNDPDTTDPEDLLTDIAAPLEPRA